MPSEAAIIAKVASVLQTYGTDIDVLKSAGVGVADVYGQGDRTFDAAVSVRGRAIQKPTQDQLSFIGNDDEVEIAFLFSRTELVAKFPSAGENEWLEKTDEFGWEGRRFRALSVHPTGRVQAYHAMVAVVAETIPGASDTYP